jgi:beta-xylosidase
LRLTNKRVDSSFVNARNSLTQRSFGPQSSARVALETANMKDGDYSGLGALQARYGFVAIAKSGGNRSIVMVDTTSGSPQEITRIGLFQDRVYLRIDMDFRNQTDQATFYYSLNGTNWTSIGSTIRMTYDLKHFMGYRFALFNYGTQQSGGYVDFDYYRLSN